MPSKYMQVWESLKGRSDIVLVNGKKKTSAPSGGADNTGILYNEFNVAPAGRGIWSVKRLNKFMYGVALVEPDNYRNFALNEYSVTLGYLEFLESIDVEKEVKILEIKTDDAGLSARIRAVTTSRETTSISVTTRLNVYPSELFARDAESNGNLASPVDHEVWRSYKSRSLKFSRPKPVA